MIHDIISPTTTCGINRIKICLHYCEYHHFLEHSPFSLISSKRHQKKKKTLDSLGDRWFMIYKEYNSELVFHRSPLSLMIYQTKLWYHHTYTLLREGSCWGKNIRDYHKMQWEVVHVPLLNTIFHKINFWKFLWKIKSAQTWYKHEDKPH